MRDLNLFDSDGGGSGIYLDQTLNTKIPLLVSLVKHTQHVAFCKQVSK